MAHDLMPWAVAYRWFQDWTARGIWQQIHEQLRDRVRIGDGRNPAPSAAAMNAHSVKSAEGGEAIGYDAGRRVRGRKRHPLLVDTIGLVLKTVVHSASIQDVLRAELILSGMARRFPMMELIWVDGGYANVVARSSMGWAARYLGIELVAMARNADVKGFTVSPQRWVVERTFG